MTEKIKYCVTMGIFGLILVSISVGTTLFTVWLGAKIVKAVMGW